MGCHGALQPPRGGPRAADQGLGLRGRHRQVRNLVGLSLGTVVAASVWEEIQA